MNKSAAIYARVSSDRQKENQTIASQTAALNEYAKSHGYLVPAEWVFEDDGYSGASLIRPGLESLRDLVAQGQIEAALVYAPDRLSRKYAYQVLLGEEFARCGVSLVFLKAPSGETPEDQLLVQFQGMIAEYERAQIAERTRRGKRHKAQQGQVNVLSGAPYGYRYIKKSDNADAYYEINEAEAEVVRIIFDAYTKQRSTINAIARLLNERQIPTRTATTRWERSTVWSILRNPAYEGKACFGKTELRPRQRITRRLRQRNRPSSRNSANHERPRHEWIEIPVPALVSETTFALAQEQLQKNKHHSPRRTIEPTLLQGMLVCQHCGYALYRSSAVTSKRKLYYYRCLGSDAYRHLKGSVCSNRPIRQDYLDEFVWKEIIRLLDEPALIQSEIDRRMQAARNADPLRKREQALRHQQTRLKNNIDRMVTAYQEELITLAELRQRVPNLRKQKQAVDSELRSLELASEDQSRYLRLTQTLSEFRGTLRVRAETLDTVERQKILRLVVQEILVGADTIRIQHSIPVIDPGSGGHFAPAPSTNSAGGTGSRSYLLRTGSHDSALRRSRRLVPNVHFLHHAGFQETSNQVQNSSVRHASGDSIDERFVGNRVVTFFDVHIDDPHPARQQILLHLHARRLDASPRAESVAIRQEFCFENRFDHAAAGFLHDSVAHRRQPQWPELVASRFRDIVPPDRTRFVPARAQLLAQLLQLRIRLLGKLGDGDSINSRSLLAFLSGNPMVDPGPRRVQIGGSDHLVIQCIPLAASLSKCADRCFHRLGPHWVAGCAPAEDVFRFSQSYLRRWRFNSAPCVLWFHLITCVPFPRTSFSFSSCFCRALLRRQFFGTMDALTPLLRRTSGCECPRRFGLRRFASTLGSAPFWRLFDHPARPLRNYWPSTGARGLLSSPALLPNRAIRHNRGTSALVFASIHRGWGLPHRMQFGHAFPSALSTSSTFRLTAQFFASRPSAPSLTGTHCRSATSPVRFRRGSDLNQLEAGITPRHILAPFQGAIFAWFVNPVVRVEKTHAYHWLISIHASGVRKTPRYRTASCKHFRTFSQISTDPDGTKLYVGQTGFARWSRRTPIYTERSERSSVTSILMVFRKAIGF
jgi:site-specific DNA recombinase